MKLLLNITFISSILFSNFVFSKDLDSIEAILESKIEQYCSRPSFMNNFLYNFYFHGASVPQFEIKNQFINISFAKVKKVCKSHFDLGIQNFFKNTNHFKEVVVYEDFIDFGHIAINKNEIKNISEVLEIHHSDEPNYSVFFFVFRHGNDYKREKAYFRSKEEADNKRLEILK